MKKALKILFAFCFASLQIKAQVWNPAATCNYAVGRTQAISAITIHDTEGSYAGSVAWFQTCPCPSGTCPSSCPSGYRGCNGSTPIGASSAHYVIRSSDGQITQMVADADRAYHVGTENGYTIGIEHEGYCSQSGWYTNTMYCSSATLVKTLCVNYSINPTTTYSGAACTCSQNSTTCLQSSSIKIKGHQMFPNATHYDPGINWDWAYYYSLVNGPSCAGSTCSQPSNDYCSTPFTLTPSVSCSYTHGTTCGATPPTNGLATTCSTNSPPDDDVWYQFTATSTVHAITLQPISSTFDGVIELMSGTCPSSLSNVACANSFGVGSTETLTATGLTIGNSYFVRIFSNGNGITNTGDFNICVTSSSSCTPVTVATQPISQSTTSGNSVTFTVIPAGTPIFTYQWYKNGVLINGATSNPYTTPNLTTADNGSTYYCVVSNCAGANSIITNTVIATVTNICTGVTITTQPTNQSASVGGTATFSVTASGTGPFTYQWYKNGTQISGATNYFYQTPTLSLSDNSNTYYCYVTNCGGSNNTTSSTATLTVTNTCTAVSISTQPTNQSATAGGTATFSIATGGTAPFTYQWYKNGVAISGATNSSYTTPTLSISDNGNYYYCVVTNCSGSYSATSNTATLTVVSSCIGVSITSQTSYQYATVGNTATFIVNVSGTAPFTYQWYKNGVLIANANNSFYTTPSLTLLDDGSNFYCVVTNCSSSNTATSVNAPVYVSQPQTCFNCPCWNWAKSDTGTILQSAFGYGNIAIDSNQNIYAVGTFSSSTITFGSVSLTNLGSNDVYLVKYDSSGNVIWAKRAGGSGDDKGFGVTTDRNGNVFILGNYASSSVVMGSTTLTHPGYFVAKYDPNGNVLWAKGDGGTIYHNAGGNPIATDTSGNIFITGTFVGTITLGGTSYTNSFNSNIFIAKLNNAGAFLWAKAATGSGADSNLGNGIATDISGNAYITGRAGPNTVFGSFLWNIEGMYVAKYDASGNVINVYGATSGGGIGSGIAVNNSYVFVTGWFTTSSISCGPYTTTNSNSGNSDILLARFNTSSLGASGVWSIGNTGNDEGYNIVTDANMGVYVTGNFQSSSLSFPGSTTLSNLGSSSSDYDAFVVKYDANGFNTESWAKAVDGPTKGWGLAVNRQGRNVYLSGDYYNNVIFNYDTLASSNPGLFVTKLSYYGPSQPSVILGNSNPCAGSTQTYSTSPVSGATTYVWQATNGTVTGTGTSVSVAWNNASSGIIQVASQNSCGLSAYKTLNVTLNGAPAQPATISGNSNPCQNSAATYSISPVAGATSYNWQATNGTVSGSGTSITVTWNSSSTGVVQVAAVNSCGQSAFKILNVTLSSPPNQPSGITGNTNPCASSSAVYTISSVAGATAYSWQCTNGSVSGTGTSVTVTWNSGTTGTLQVASQNSCGLSSYQTLNVTFNNVPSQPSSISGITNPCQGSTNSYSITPVANATSYSWTLPNGWQGSSTTASINTVASNTSGSISVSAINGCGSGIAQNLSVNPISLPNIIVNSPAICIGQIATLVASGGSSYAWGSGLTANGDTAYSSPISTTNYSVIGTLNGCSKIAFSTVTVNSPVSGTISSLPNIVCFNHPLINISGTPAGGTFSGFGISGNTFIPSNAVIGVNTITYAYTSNGCSATTSQNIQVDTLITPVITAIGNTSFCFGDSVTIIGNINNGVWSNSSNSPAITVSASGTFFLTNTSTCGSVNSNQIIVVANQLPTVTANATANTICNGASVTLNAGGASTYTWTGGVTNGVAFNPTATNTYTVTGTDANNCSNTATTTVTVNQLPTVTANATANTICNGASVTLTGGGASTYTWTGGVSNGVAFNPTATNTYTVTGTDANNCSNTATTTVTVNQLPTVTANATANTICNGASVTLNAGGASTYTWTGGVTNGVAFNPTATNTYTVTGTDANNCSNTATTTVTVNQPPTVTANATANTICNGASVTLTGGGASTYTWTGGVSNGVAFNPTATNTYTVTGTDANNCSNTATTTVTVNPQPIADFAASQTTGNCPFTVDFFNQSTTSGTTTYLWTFYTGGSPITSTLPNPTGILYNVAGSFLVKLDVTDTCGTNTKTVANYITVSCPVVIADIEQSANISVYPNPTNDILNLVGNGLRNDNYTATWTNVLGQKLFENEFVIENNKIEKQIDVKQLSSGIYFLTVSSTKTRQVFKINKQ